MRLKKTFIIICLVVCLFAMASVCASEANDALTDAGDNLEITDNDYVINQTDELTKTDEGLLQSANAVEGNDLQNTEDDENRTVDLEIASSGENVLKSSNQMAIDSDATSDNLGEDLIGDFNILQNLINNAEENSITLDRNYTFTAGLDENLIDGIVINKEGLTIEGNGYTIDAAGKSRIFNINANDVKLNNITFINAQHDFGGAIYWQGDSGSVSNCSFRDNSATDGGAVYWNGVGGHVSGCGFADNFAGSSGAAIYWRGTEGSITNSIFINNSANRWGGTIILGGSDATVSNCGFINNSADIGGAIHVDGADAKLSNCGFINNSADTGGAINVGGADAKLSNCGFINNSADTGGAINVGGADAKLDNCNFTNNSAKSQGGAISFSSAGTVEFCNFTNNAANEGGAISGGGAAFCILKTSSDTLHNTDIPTFTVSNPILRYDRGEKLLFNLTYDNKNYDGYNTTITLTRDGDLVGVYYALSGSDEGWSVDLSPGIYTATLSLEPYAVNPTTVKICVGMDMGRYSELSLEIGSGGDIKLQKNYYMYDYGNTIEITDLNTVIDGNGATIDMAGSNKRAFYIKAAGVTIKNLTVKNANVDDFGGAIYWCGSDGVVSGCSFVDNSAINNGGAIYWKGAESTVSTGTLCFDVFYLNGEGIIAFLKGDRFSCGDVEFEILDNVVLSPEHSICRVACRCLTPGEEGNIPKYGINENRWMSFEYVHVYNDYDFGGGFTYECGVRGSVVNCSFINNSAQYGGTIYWQGGSGSVSNCSFRDNSATDGGAIYWNKVDGYISGCGFADNFAGSSGAAIYWRGTEGSITNSIFINNSANRWGGTIVLGGSNTTVSNCGFINNSADVGGAIHVDGANAKLSNCNFTNNTANDGGAVYWNGRDGHVSSCSFADNFAGSSGAAIYWRGTEGSITNSIFINNSANRWGGTIILGGSDATVSNCGFINNSADVGGAIHVDGANAKLSNCGFINNSADTGGAINVGGANAKLFNCSFTNNTAKSQGGAIRFGSAGTVEFCNFTNNVANEGGAVYFTDTHTVDTCIFKTSSDTTFNTVILPPILNVDDLITVYGSVGKLTFDLKTNSGIPVTNGIISIRVYFKNNNSWVGDYSCLIGEVWTVDLPVGSYYAIFNIGYTEFKPINRTLTVTDGTTFWDLNQTINNNAANEITLDRNYNFNSSSDSKFVDGIAIGRAVTINGNGHTINANGKARIFQIEADNVVLNNIAFTNANYGGDGGAILFRGAGNVTNCNFTGNNASKGSAIYFVSDGSFKSVSNSIFLNNKANAEALEITKNDHGILITFMGNDNLLNAIYSEGDVSFTNVTYWGAKGISNTGNSPIKPSRSINEAGQNIILEIYDYGDSLVKNVTLVTDDNGQAIYDFSNGKYKYNVYHLEDSYYTYAETNDTFTLGPGDFNLLQSYINGVDSVLTLNRSYTFSIGLDENLTDGIVIDKPITINGNGYTINARQKARIFHVTAKNVVLNNITFVNAIASDEGGAVKFQQYGSVTNCNFTNNTVINGDGGAILMGSGSVTNCNFVNNTVISGKGGAIWMYSGSVENCNFIDNRASYEGGAIWMGSGSAINCNFTNNQATGSNSWGGAIRMHSGSVTNCNFVNNTVISGKGGAIRMDSGSAINCNFTNNKAEYYGGAVYSAEGKVSNCNFTNNTVINGDGGAILFSGLGTVINCNFTNNQATGSNSWGGAIQMHSGSVTNCIFINNSADTGGAIFSGKGSTADTCIFKTSSDTTVNTDILPPILDVDDFTLFYNSGEKLTFDLRTDSGIPVTNGNISISVYYKNNDSWVGNYSCLSGEGWNLNLPIGSYYAIFDTEYAEFKPINRTITIMLNNFLGLNCIINSNDYSVINLNNDFYFDSDYDSEFVNGIVINRPVTINGNGHTINANGKARIFQVTVDNAVLTNITFTNATAGNGGAVYLTRSATVENCNFTDNKATGNGGAIYFASSGTIHEVRNCNFTNNSAAYGGAVYLSRSGSLENCNFAENKASNYGGAVYLSISGNVTNCNFTDNKATGSNSRGGAIWMSSGNVENCNFTGNNATTGSAIYFNKYYSTDTLNISNSCFLNNRANAESLEVTKNENNLTITFKGNNNLLNAIYSNGDVSFTNVTYWGANGIENTGSSAPVRSNNGAGQNITVGVFVNGELVLNEVKVTDENGTIVLNISAGENYYIGVRHNTDSYYTEAERTISNNMTFIVNLTSQTTTNRTVNITAKSNIYNEFMPAKLLFVLSNSTEITATYAGNGIWWAVHTFDDYVVYEVNATYSGLENVIINNATVYIEQTDINLNANYTVTVLNDGFAVQFIINTNPALDNENLTVKFNGNEYPVTVLNGTANFTSDKVYANTYSTEIIYTGSKQYKNTSTTVDAIVKSTTVSRLNTFSYYYYNNDMGSDSEKGISKIKVIDSDGKPIKNGLVTITIMNKYKLKVRTDASGVAKFTKAYKPGTYSVTATHNNKVTNLGNLVLKSVVNVPKVTTVKKSAKTTTIKITLKGTGPIKGKTVVVNLNKKSYQVTTDKNGVASFVVTQKMVEKLAAGKTYKIRVTYRMDSVAQSIKIAK